MSERQISWGVVARTVLAVVFVIILIHGVTTHDVNDIVASIAGLISVTIGPVGRLSWTRRDK